MWYSPATPRINQHTPWQTDAPSKTNKQKTWTINKELKANTQQRGGVAGSTPERRGEARSWSPYKLSVNKGWKGRRANSRQEQHPNSNDSAKLKNNQQTIGTHWQQGASWWITDLAPEKGGEAKKQAPSKQAQWKPNCKAGQLVTYRADYGTWGQHTNLNCHIPLRE
jgi:hypothetical protein